MMNMALFLRVVPIFARAFLGVLVFSQHVKKRSAFWLRYALCFLGGAFLSYLIALLTDAIGPEMNGMVSSFLRMAAVFVLVNAGSFICFSGSIWTIMLIAASGYAIQDLAGHLKALVLLAGGWTSSGVGIAVNTAIDITLMLVIFFFIWRMLRDHGGNGEEYLDNRYKALLSLSVMLICLGMGRLTNGNPDRNTLAQIAENIYAILVSGLLLLSVYGSSARAKLTHDVGALREMMHLQRVQFESNRENVQLVNEKYHDINKLLSSLTLHVPEKQIENLRTEISSYDAQTHTGNEALDVVLTERRLHCNARNIELTIMADGQILSFMEELDIYALFSNLLSNAIEAVEKLPKDMERFIILKVSQSGNMVTIHEENPCAGEIAFENGLPQTTNDPEWHGFGMRSMERVAEKYGGTLTVMQKESLFLADILLFSPEKPVQSISL